MVFKKKTLTHMQRRNQIIFTSSRASSRRRWPHTLLHRSGPRKDSREKKGSQRTLPPKMRTRNRSGDLERDFERGVVSPERNLKRQPKTDTIKHSKYTLTHANAKPMRPRNTSGGRFATASMAAYTEDGRTEEERKREKRRAKIRRAPVTTGEGRRDRLTLNQKRDRGTHVRQDT